MKKLFLLLIVFLLISCANKNLVYWCGDHPCINKKEKESYFKKTMIVEVKEITKSKKNNSEIEKITQQARLNEKKRIKEEKYLAKQERLEVKKRIKEEKYLAKQERLEVKKIIKEEKYLIKQERLKEKMRIKNEKKLTKQTRLEKKKKNKDKKKSHKIQKTEKITKIDTQLAKNDTTESTFDNLLDKVLKQNTLKPYPDINNIPD